MSTLNVDQKKQLKSLVKSDGFHAILIALDDFLKDNGTIESVTGADEFESLRDLHKRQGLAEGLLRFFNNLETEKY